MKPEDNQECCRLLLSGLVSANALEEAIQKGVSEDCFSDDGHRKAFRYLKRRLKQGKPVSPEDVERQAGAKLARHFVDVGLYAPAVVTYHLAASARHQMDKALDKLDIEGGAPTAIKELKEELAKILFLLPEAVSSENRVEVAAGEKPPPIPWAIPGILPQGLPCMLYGKGGTGKSSLATLIAKCVATGEEFLGQWNSKKMNVLMVDFEGMGVDNWKRRLHELDGNSPTFEAALEEMRRRFKDYPEIAREELEMRNL